MTVNKSNHMRNQNDTVIYLGHYHYWCSSMPLYAGEVFLCPNLYSDQNFWDDDHLSAPQKDLSSLKINLH